MTIKHPKNFKVAIPKHLWAKNPIQVFHFHSIKDYKLTEKPNNKLLQVDKTKVRESKSKNKVHCKILLKLSYFQIILKTFTTTSVKHTPIQQFADLYNISAKNEKNRSF